MLIANTILNAIQDEKANLISNDKGEKVFTPFGYKRFTIKQLIDLLGYDLHTLVYAARLLQANNHVKLLEANDWYEISISCTNEGEQALREDFYKEMELLADAKYTNALKDKYFIHWTILTAIVGYIVGLFLPAKLPEALKGDMKTKVEKSSLKDSTQKK